jgi:hypothetical protein
MAERKERHSAAQEGVARPGACPRCGTPVLFARELGFLTVVDAIPVRYESTWQSMVPGSFYGIFCIVRGQLKALLHDSDVRRTYGVEYVHTEHVSCGRVVPRLTEMPKPQKVDNDVPPFESGLKTWRCWDCQEIIPPERQAVVIQYNGPNVSYYYCHCDQQCQPVHNRGQLGTRKVKYPKINPRTMKYDAPKKGEVLPE